MSWSYSGDPSYSTQDKVRFLIGDTDESDQQVSDEEIAAILVDFPNPYNAAVQIVRSLVAKYSRRVEKSKSIGDLSISYSSAADGYRDLLKSLLTQAALHGGLCEPYAGGISISDKENQESDSDRVVPAFRIGMHDRKEE